MGEFFSMDGSVFRFLSKVADLMVLNLLFLVCCIPIVTAGASFTALAYVTLKMKDQEEGYVWKSFLRSFRQNFRQSTAIWLLLLALAALLWADFRISSVMEGTGGQAVRILAGAGGLVWFMVFLYVFPLQARFYNTIGGILRNALLLALGNFPRTLAMMLVTGAAACITFFNGYTLWYGLLFWILLGFALLAWLNSHLLYGAFLKIMPSREEGTEKETEGKNGENGINTGETGVDK